MTQGSCGLDLRANIKESLILKSNKINLIGTGIKIAMPENFEAQIRSRSGLALNHGVIVLNSPGTIDFDYRGEIKVILINLLEQDYLINRGDRIAQLVINKIYKPEFILCDEQDLDKSSRDSNGFGSTGV
jgi:dUTP pyrophosphatase